MISDQFISDSSIMAHDKKSPNNNIMQEILFDLYEPVIFEKILCTEEGSNRWKLLNWSLEDLADKCGDLKLPFRVGENARTFVNGKLKNTF